MNSIPDDPHAPNTPGWLKGHPTIDPKHPVVVFQKPDDAGTVGEPAVRERIVIAAIDAVNGYSGDLRRNVAADALKYWRSYGDMTAAEIDAVLDTYPVSKSGRKKPRKPGPTTNRRGI